MKQKVKEYLANFNFPLVVKVQLTLHFCDLFMGGSPIPLFINEYILQDETDVVVLDHSISPLLTILGFLSSIITDYKFGRFKMSIFMYTTYFFRPLIFFSLSSRPKMKYIKELFFTGYSIYQFLYSITEYNYVTFIYDQFKLPEQQKMFETYIILDFIVLLTFNAISNFLGPYFRNTSCFSMRYCFPLVFGLIGVSNYISAVTFFSLSKFYKRTYPLPSKIKDYLKCIWYAIKNRKKIKGTEKKKHWLDYAEDRHPENIIKELKVVNQLFKLLIIAAILNFGYGPTRNMWLFQARQMDGDLGFWVLLPDQIYFPKDIFLLMFYPTMKFVVVPALEKKNILTNYCHRFAIAVFVCALGLTCSGICLIFIERREPILPQAGQGHISIFNSLPCDITVEATALVPSYAYIPKFGYHHYEVKVIKSIKIPYTINGDCVANLSSEFIAEQQVQKGYFFQDEQIVIPFEYSMQRDSHAHNKLFTCFSVQDKTFLRETLEIWDKEGHFVYKEKVSSHEIKLVTRLRDMEIRIGNYSKHDFYLHSGGVNTIIGKVYKNKTVDLKFHTLTQRPVNMLYILPQILMFHFSAFFHLISITVLKYAGTPPAIRSMICNISNLMGSAANSLISVYVKIKFVKESTKAFCLSGLIIITMFVLIYLGRDYKLPHFDEEENRTGKQNNIDINEDKDMEKDTNKLNVKIQ